MSVRPSPFRSRALITRARSGVSPNTCCRHLGETEARAGIEEHLVRLRRARRRVVAAVGEEQVGAAVAVEVGDFDLVGPVRGLADGGRGHVVPQRTAAAWPRRSALTSVVSATANSASGRKDRPVESRDHARILHAARARDARQLQPCGDDGPADCLSVGPRQRPHANIRTIQAPPARGRPKRCELDDRGVPDAEHHGRRGQPPSHDANPRSAEAATDQRDAEKASVRPQAGSRGAAIELERDRSRKRPCRRALATVPGASSPGRSNCAACSGRGLLALERWPRGVLARLRGQATPRRRRWPPE